MSGAYAERPGQVFQRHALLAMRVEPGRRPRGELFVGGPCLASGPSTRFLVHPRLGERLLRTGLAARFLPGGLLEILGREGEWVAHRFGYPVEPRRIEAALERHPAVRAAVDVPVIASGGAGAVEHFAPAVRAGADAVLAASVFHFGTLRIGQVKDALRAENVEVR